MAPGTTEYPKYSQPTDSQGPVQITTSEDPPPAYQDPAPSPPSQTTTKLGEYCGKIRWSHLWFLLLNLATIALTICVLSSCRDASSAKYSLLNLGGSTLEKAVGCDECNLGVYQYRVGLSGACRQRRDETECTQGFPYSFNLEKVVRDGATFQLDSPLVSTTNPYGSVSKLAISLGVLLAISVVIGFITIGVAVTQPSGFSEINLLPLILDAILLLISLGLFSAIFILETFAKEPGVSITDFVGVGAWLLLAAFMCRLLSNPVLAVGFLIVVAFLSLFPIACCLACVGACCGSLSEDNSRSYYSSDLVTTQPQRDDQLMAMAAVQETETTVASDGSYFQRVRTAYAVVTTI
ncbi:hypothetical protein P154DRAFT_537284 [Amniculicola lignicola CBS 123094]|uniref:Uncharacterized protein n=1 Tax=Amniculicola lignicola CBS 123094 TaxID=1392246 RepID=A0A6A5W613_9PLEO|nr:hypothetical protein P154DRAFT_537284 [Amniculicola lignicola CBS 123094]